MFTLNAMSEFGARAYRDRVATIFEGRSLTYAGLDAQANRIANYLLSVGVGRGERVAVLSENCDTYLAIYLGVAKAGAVTAPLNTRLSDAEMTAILQNCEPKLYLASTEFAERARQQAGQLQAVEVDRRAAVVDSEESPRRGSGVAAVGDHAARDGDCRT